MRLIDAIAYRRVLEEEKDYQLEHCKDSFKYQCGLEIAIADLGDMPTIDAVPVVRCKDCIVSYCFGDEDIVCGRTCVNVDADDFCSYGERKEAEGDG